MIQKNQLKNLDFIVILIAISPITFYKWRGKYGGMETSDIKHLKALKAKNHKLKQMFAELSLKSQLQKQIITTL
ncbi:MAG: transposase [Gilliamella sp.]|nr:transposase [Gilliamella sp.]